ncbi:HAD-IC family P-type ATPase [Sphaerisporangium sp. TRM90804]|uniref:cation-translocating P-type ATPase n=1 Tax=Sphaerisporangium sp. TRM90804 TaxID=3031113 RepID=UPI002449FE7F|nr:HAD-IC family P-type ATPase [Sphaerisporangium sp. TRM90804]MDH2428810.1 HAD-IC family P-type ATPase [Sphaerisporangium sp. TRM90804]
MFPLGVLRGSLGTVTSILPHLTGPAGAVGAALPVLRAPGRAVSSLVRELKDPLGAMTTLLPEPVRDLLPRPRQLHPCPGGVRVELRTIGGPGTGPAARVLEERLCALDDVERAEVNGALRFVFVCCDTGAVDRQRVLSVIEQTDVADQGEPDEGERDHHHRVNRHAVEHQARAIVELSAGLAGIGLSIAGQLTGVARVPPVLPALMQLAEATPSVRRALERRLGAQTAGFIFATTRYASQTLALRPLGLAIDSLAALGRFTESQAGREAWAVREEEFARRKGSYRFIRTAVAPRPVPLPRGPIERYADVVSIGALGSYGLTAVLSSDGRRALAMLVAGTPKAARLGRDAFLSSLGRATARRGGLVLNRDALRVMDRLDTVVFDAETLTMGPWIIHEVLPLVPDEQDLHSRVYTLLEGVDATVPRRRDDWAAEPLAQVPREAAHWPEGVRPVAVKHGRRRVALVGMVPEVHPYAEALVGATGDTCRVLLAGGDRSLGWRLGADGFVAGGARLAASVRELQAAGNRVAVVGQRARRGLGEADLGIGLLSRSARPPWDAAVVGGPDAAYVLLKSVSRVKATSERCLRVSAVGATAGGLLAVLSPGPRALRRVQIAGDGTSLVSLAWGVWAGRDLDRVTLPPRADRTPWHALPAHDVLSRVSSTAAGLPEAEAVRRRERPAKRAVAGPASLLRASAEELANPLTPVLGVAAAVSVAVGSALDAVLIAGVLAVNGLIGGTQRAGAARALRRLEGATAVPVRLRRPEGTVGVTADKLVRGDVIELRAGDAVPADGRVLKARGLEVDESSLTGESQLVTKSPAPTAALSVADRSSMVYEGTTVAAGFGTAVVVSTGTATEAGRTAELGDREAPPSGVELRLRALSRQIMPVAFGSGVLLMVTNLLRNVSPATALAPAVSLAVAAVPEGLPFIATLAELAAARRLSVRETLVRNPSTIEALGRVDVLCFDKTGTLTEGRISLRRVSDGRVERPLEELPADFRRILAAALRASPPSGGGRVIAHLTDRAVVDGAKAVGVSPQEDVPGWERVDELPFEPSRGYHAVLGVIVPTERGGEAAHLLSVKGAPEVLLTRCTTMLSDGEVLALDEAAAESLAKEVDRLAEQGYRVLAVAERAASSRQDLDESRIDDLCFLGYLGLADPVRPTAAQSVGRLLGAGVRVVMVTGDHPSTAEAIAAELNLLNGQRVMTGPELEGIDDSELAEVLPDVSVFARATPADKARIVDGLQRAGRVVAVTGDGANDAPAIRLADVGIALGSRATPAARAAADVVVTDDRIETIVDAIVEGRAMWSSVRDALSMLLGGNLGEIVFTVGSNLVSGRNTLNARQLLLVNLLTDMLPALAIAVRPPASTSPAKLLREGPEASLGAALTRDIYLRAGITASAAFLAWTFGRVTGGAARADTIGLIGLVSAQLVQTLAISGRDRTVLAATAASLAALALAVSLPGLSHLFGCRPVGPLGWAIGLGSGAAAGAVSRLISSWDTNGH